MNKKESTINKKESTTRNPWVFTEVEAVHYRELSDKLLTYHYSEETESTEQQILDVLRKFGAFLYAKQGWPFGFELIALCVFSPLPSIRREALELLSLLLTTTKKKKTKRASQKTRSQRVRHLVLALNHLLLFAPPSCKERVFENSPKIDPENFSPFIAFISLLWRACDNCPVWDKKNDNKLADLSKTSIVWDKELTSALEQRAWTINISRSVLPLMQPGEVAFMTREKDKDLSLREKEEFMKRF